MDELPERIEDCRTEKELLLVLLREIKFHNDGDTNEQEFAISVCKLAERAEKQLQWMLCIENHRKDKLCLKFW